MKPTCFHKDTHLSASLDLSAKLGRRLGGLFAFFAVALSACSDDFFSQTVAIDPPAYEKQLSFHLNLVDSDSTVRLVLSRNYGILETVPDISDYFVSGGSAELYQDGQKWLTLTPLSADSSFVLVGKLPQTLHPGSTYEIRAEHPDFPKVSAIQVMPGEFGVDSARLKHNVGSGQFGEKFDLVEVFFNDPPGVRNYYEVKISDLYLNISYDPNTGMLDTIGYTEYPIYVEDFTDPNVAFGVQGSGLISDQFFEGKSYKLQARISGYDGSRYVVHVRNITEEYYRWSRSYQAKSDAEDNPLIEPISVFNNLTNGLGIFSVAREKVFVVQ